MAHALLRGAAAVVLVLAAVFTAQAQTESIEHHDHEGSHQAARGLCGTFTVNSGSYTEALANTARRNPELYRRMVAGTKHGESRLAVAARNGLVERFLIRNSVTNQFDEIEAELMFMGRRTRIWVDVRDASFVRQATLDTLARGLDSVTAAGSRNPAKGIIENDEEVFGMPPVNRYDPSTPYVEDFLLTDIPNSISTGDVLGFFSPLDQTNDPGSNKMNILYIDTKPGLGNQGRNALIKVLSTLAHEYQHLIHYNMNVDSEVFFNEGCSELASTLCGYFDRENSGFLSNTNVPLLRWNYDDPLDDYERSLTYMRYLYERLGENFITQFVKYHDEEMVRVGGALMAIGQPADNWKKWLKTFAVANYLQRNFPGPDSQYVYRRPLSNSTARVHNSYANEVPASGSLIAEQYAAFYNLYSFTTPAGIRIKFDASRPFTVMAILFRNSTAVVEEVRELAPGVEHVLGEAVGYRKIVFVVVNFDYGAQTVRWTASQLVSSVEDDAAAVAGVAQASLAPNPAAGAVRMAYSLPVAGTVHAELLDMEGRTVRTFLNGVQRESGEHAEMLETQGLPAGAYIVRLRHDGRSTTRKLVIVR